MSIEIINHDYIDPDTGVRFFSTGCVDPSTSNVTTSPEFIILDQMTNAAGCRFDARWLITVSDLKYIDCEGVRDALDEAARRTAARDGKLYRVLQHKKGLDYDRIKGAKEHAAFLLKTANILETCAAYGRERRITNRHFLPDTSQVEPSQFS